MSELSALGKAAVYYASAGLAIIPLRPRDKVPMIRGGSKNATANVEQVRDYWLANPNCNIGIVCGSVSDGLVAIDIDSHTDGIDGWDFINEFEAEMPLPDAPTVRTGSGGSHIFMRFPGKVKTSANPNIGVDIRAEGGYVVAPPSIHPNGRAYEWVKGKDLKSLSIPVADRNASEFLAVVQPESEIGEGLKLPDKVHEGEGRDNILYKIACSFRAKNMPESAALAALKEINKTRCVPPLELSVVKQKVKSAYKKPAGLSDEAKAKAAQSSSGSSGSGNTKGRGQRFDHALIAARLIDEHGACLLDGITPALRNENREYMVGLDAFDEAIINMAPGCTLANRKEVKAYIQALAPKKEQSAWNLIAFNNGVLDIASMELRDWREDDVIANVIPHNWNPEAESKLLDNLIDKLAVDDAGVKMNLIETIGICMARSSKVFHFCPVFIGSGSNGKSTFMGLIADVLGQSNVSSLQPKEISMHFQAANLVGKLANIGDDIANSFLDGDACAAIKRVVTGDRIFTDVKGSKGFSFMPYATIVLSCNQFPTIKDTTDGFMRRLHAVNFAARFTSDDEDYNPMIAFELKKESVLEYACKIGIEGLCNVIKNHRMTPNHTNEQAKMDIAESGNTALQWINSDGIQQSDILDKSIVEVYRMYERWCEDNGYTRTKLASKAVVNFVRDKFGTSCTKNSHRGTGIDRKTVKVFEIRH